MVVSTSLLAACGSSEHGGSGEAPPSSVAAHPGTLLVLDHLGLPIPSLEVLIDGALVTTDAHGSAPVPNLAPSYDALTGINSLVFAYHGLTSEGPTLKLRVAPTTAARSSSFSLETKTEPGPNRQVFFSFGVAGGGDQWRVTGGAQYLTIEWDGSPNATLSTEAFLVDVDPNTQAVIGYAGYAQQTWALSDGMNAIWQPAFSAPPFETKTIHLDVSIPADNKLMFATLRFSPSAGKQSSFGVQQPVSPSIDFLVPATSTRYEVGVQGGRGNDASFATAHEVSPGARVSLTLPAATAAISPADGASEVGLDTEFTWSPVTDAVYNLSATASPLPATNYFVYSSTPSVHLPDARALGVALPQFTSYSWAAGYVTQTSLDAYAAGQPSAGSASGSGTSATRSFTTLGNSGN